MRALVDRFWMKVRKTNTCWLWTGSKNKGGYGTFKVSTDETDYAHRVVYELLVGEIPAGMTIDHRCRVRLCVNPNHLMLATVGENIRLSRNHRGKVNEFAMKRAAQEVQ
jgi:hypothetical protein